MHGHTNIKFIDLASAKFLFVVNNQTFFYVFEKMMTDTGRRYDQKLVNLRKAKATENEAEVS